MTGELKRKKPDEITIERRSDGLVEVRFKQGKAEAHFALVGAMGCTSSEPGRIHFTTTEGAGVQLELRAMMNLHKPATMEAVTRRSS
jgi:hypothetical protein